MKDKKEYLENIYEKFNNPNNERSDFYHSNIFKTNGYFKFVASILTILILSSSIIFAKNYSNIFTKTTTGIIDYGVNTAIDNDYIQNIDMEYSYSHKIGVKLEHILMDDSTLSILVDINFKNGIKRSAFDVILEDLIITDENNNVIYCEDPTTYEKYCKQNNIPFTKGIYDSNNIYTSEYSGKIIENSENNIKYLYTLNSVKGFPNSKKLFFKFYKIGIRTTQFTTDKMEDFDIYKGKWNLSIDLAEKFINRESIIYSINNADAPDIEVLEFQVNNSNTKLKFKSSQKINSEYLYKNIRLLNDNGKEFNISIEGENSLFIDTNNVINVSLNLTKYDATENLKLTIPINDSTIYNVDLLKSK